MPVCLGKLKVCAAIDTFIIFSNVSVFIMDTNVSDQYKLGLSQLFKQLTCTLNRNTVSSRP